MRGVRNGGVESGSRVVLLAFPVLLQYSVLNRILTELNRFIFYLFFLFNVIFYCLLILNLIVHAVLIVLTFWQATWSFMVFAMHELVFHCC